MIKDQRSSHENELAMELEAWSRNLAGCPWSPWAPHTRILLEKAAKALRAHAQCVPDGWVVVPKEPTDAMCEAMLDRIEDAEAGRGAPFKWPDIEHMFDIYTEAIATVSRPAPQPSRALSG